MSSAGDTSLIRFLQQESSRLKDENQTLGDEVGALRRYIGALREFQETVQHFTPEQDVIALAQTKDQAYVEIFFIRNNKLMGRDHLLVDGIRDEEPSQIMTSFVKQYYASASSIPPVILLHYPVDEPAIITEWLGNQRGAPVKLHVPRQGAKKQLLDIVTENAHQGLELHQIKQSIVGEPAVVLEELKEEFDAKEEKE